jgi:hypothetical protein
MSVLSRATSSSPQQKPTARRQPALKTAPKSKLRHEDSQVDFTAVESSSPVAMESQLLTEHQREVKSRQQFETTPLYPEFSSSPGPRRRASKTGLPFLDFSSQQAVMDTGYATPTLHDEHGPMDEYITSSPTPKAAEKLQPSAIETKEAENSVFEAEDNEIPSSPPEMEDETVYDGTTELENLQTTEQQDMNDALMDTAPEDFSTIVPQEESKIDDSRALPEEFTTVEPAANAPLEAHPSVRRLAQNLEGGVSSDIFTDARSELNLEAVASKDNTKHGSEVAEVIPEDQDAVESDDSSPIPFTDSHSEQLQEELESPAESLQSKAPEAVAAPGDISRVMDSFVGATDDDAEDTASVQAETCSSPSSKVNHTSSASKRKREEPPETRASAKRRKSSASPFRRIVTRTLSYLTGSQVPKEDDEDEDEEMQDCIVVGSQKDEVQESESEAAEHSPIPESAPASAAPSNTKRGRGRPRKSTTPVVSSPVSSVRTRASKRRASTLEEENQDSLIIDTPAPTKSRRTTRSQDAKTDQPTEHVMLSPARRRRGRELEAVLVSPGPSREHESLVDETTVVDEPADDEKDDEQQDDEKDDEQQDDEQDDNQEADSQLRHEEEKAVVERPPPKGNWLIKQLKGIVINCTPMVITPQQERELQDLLYELGKCVYEAGRRSSN